MVNSKQNNKRLESAKKYMDTMIKKHARINNVRIDLSYKKPYSEVITLEEVNKDLNHMLSNMRSKPSIFQDKVGYIVKLEHTEDKGAHIHALITFNGHEVQDASHKADQIGEYWKQITKGKGSYHNCHRNVYESDRNGIGLLERKDNKKHQIVDEYVLPYLCKDNQEIKAIKNSSKDRAFKRGTVKKDQKKKEKHMG